MVYYSCSGFARMCSVPLLFNILLEVEVALALNGSEDGWNLQLSNLRFTNDISLLTEDGGDLQQLWTVSMGLSVSLGSVSVTHNV